MKRGKRMKPQTDTLPQEMCSEILCRLPVKPLAKFRSVSKTWCSIIDSPQFTLTHLTNCQNNQAKSRMLAIEPPEIAEDEQKCTIRRADEFRKISGCAFKVTRYEHYQVTGYINGVLCMKKYVKKTQLCKVFLLNPSIRKSLELPLPNLMNATSWKLDADFAFGFDSARNDYKVIASLYLSGVHIAEYAELYTLSEGSWRRIDIEMGPCSWSKDSPKVFLNGLTYWVGVDYTKTDNEKGKYTHFVSYNANNDVFNYIELPDYDVITTSEHQRFPVVLGQSIALMEIFQTISYIWVREEFGMTKSWTKKYLLEIQLYDRFLHLNTDGELLFRGDRQGMNSYNIKSKKTTVLAKTYKLTPVFTDVYMESLVLLHQADGRYLCNFPVRKTSRQRNIIIEER